VEKGLLIESTVTMQGYCMVKKVTDQGLSLVAHPLPPQLH